MYNSTDVNNSVSSARKILADFSTGDVCEDDNFILLKRMYILYKTAIRNTPQLNTDKYQDLIKELNRNIDAFPST